MGKLALRHFQQWNLKLILRYVDFFGVNYAHKADKKLILFVGCGGEMNLQQGGQAQTITSPNYPRTYPENYSCNWKINVSYKDITPLGYSPFFSLDIWKQ